MPQPGGAVSEPGGATSEPAVERGLWPAAPQLLETLIDIVFKEPVERLTPPFEELSIRELRLLNSFDDRLGSLMSGMQISNGPLKILTLGKLYSFTDKAQNSRR